MRPSALDEALSKLAIPNTVIALDSSGRLTSDAVSIDGPLDHLALYQIYLRTGTIPGVSLPDGFNPAARARGRSTWAARTNPTTAETPSTAISEITALAACNPALGLSSGKPFLRLFADLPLVAVVPES